METTPPTQPAIDVPELASRLRLVVARASRRLRRDAQAREGIAAISPSLTAALATIEAHGPLTPSELAEREQIRRPTATRIIATLVDAGLVHRTTDPGDRRSGLLTVTASGRALLRRLRKRKDAYLARRLRELEPAELETLREAAEILERVIALPEPQRRR